MKSPSSQKTNSLVIWLLVAGLIILYLRFFTYLKTLGEIIIAMLPSIIFLTIGIFVFKRDKNLILTKKEKGDYQIKLLSHWGQALKHDLLTYFVPVIIMITPFLFDRIPDITTVIQASTAFLVLAYLKLIYWGEL